MPRQKLHYVPVGTIKVDPEAQRPFNKTQAEKLAASWNDDLCDPVHLSRNGTGDTYYCDDGQHRIAARLMTAGPRALVPAIVHDDKGEVARAERFLELNTTTPVHRISKFAVAVKANRRTESAIAAILAGHGLHVGRSHGDGSMQIQCVGSLERAYRRDPESIDPALTALIAAFGTKSDTFRGPLVGGTCTFFAKYGDRIDPGRFVRQLKKAGGPLNIYQIAMTASKTFGGSLPANVTQTLVTLYNKGIRNSEAKLPPYRKQ